MAGKLHLSYPPNIARVTVQRKRLNVFGQGLWHVPFLFLYFFALRACVETSGHPYAEALAHHRAKGYDPAAFVGNAAASKQKPPQVIDDWGGGGGAEDDGWGDLEADDEDTGGAAAAAATEAAKASAANDAPAEDADAQITYETPPTLPASWLPEFWAVAWFSALATAHVLTMFAQHWSIQFRAFMNYAETDRVFGGLVVRGGPFRLSLIHI